MLIEFLMGFGLSIDKGGPHDVAHSPSLDENAALETTEKLHSKIATGTRCGTPLLKDVNRLFC